MEKHSVSRLIGSPPGYVGHEEGGQLTERIRRQPYAVVLFDEMEKAHPDVFNLLLQVMDDGSLTDSRGRRVDFRNTVIIMTSNLGAGNTARKSVGFGSGSPSERYAEGIHTALKEAFRPEFLNRVDEIIVFEPLTHEQLCRIASLLLDELADRVNGLGIRIVFDSEIAALIAQSGKDPRFGARPLRRAVIQKLEEPLSRALLTGELRPGDRVSAEVSEDGVLFIKEKDE
jgi:ATP-dependent Clp protease ATP-binding subunit ClpC